MKTKDKKALHSKTEEELQQLLKETKEALFAAKLEKSQMKLKDLRSIARKKDDIAKIATILREKEITHEDI